jgi:hypothetical protein
MMRQTNFFCAALLLLSGLGTSAREAYLRARSGEIYEGHLRFESNAAVVVNVGQGFLARVSLGEVVELVFLKPIEGSPFAGTGAGPGWLSEGFASAAWPSEDELRRFRRRLFIPELELRSGSRQRGDLLALDDTAIYLKGQFPRDPVSRSSVANIRFRPLPQNAGKFLNSGREGVLLQDGVFIDGECRGLEGGRLVLSSIPLGICRYDLSTEVVAVVLRQRGALVRHPYRIVTTDGSTWLGLEVSLDAEGVLLREPSLGVRRFPWHEIMEFERRS